MRREEASATMRRPLSFSAVLCPKTELRLEVVVHPYGHGQELLIEVAGEVAPEDVAISQINSPVFGAFRAFLRESRPYTT